MRVTAIGFVLVATAVMTTGLLGQMPAVFLVHGVLALAAVPLMLAAMQHFVPVLTRSGAPSAAIRALPWIAAGAGGLALTAFAGLAPRGLLGVAAGLNALVAIAMVVWIVRRARRTLGTPHPGVWWYVLALLALLAGMTAAGGMLLGEGSYGVWYRAHVHGNLLGWIGLTALGTLPVLLPTAIGRADAGAARRLKTDLAWAGLAVVALVFGAAWPAPLVAVVGALGLTGVAGRNALAWYRAFGPDIVNGAAGSLALALGFLLLLLLVGLAHGTGPLGPPPVMAFVVGFLLPLVTGALAQLLPVWRFPGIVTPARETYRQRLARHAPLRGAAFVGAGTMLLAGGSVWPRVAMGLALASLLSLVVALWWRPAARDAH